MIAMRLRAGPIAGLLLAVALAASLLPVAVAERFLARPLAAGDRAPITVRLPDEGRLRDPSLGERLGSGRLVAVRGQAVDAETAALVNQIQARQPGLEPTVAGLGLVFGLIGLLVAAYLRSSHRGRMLRLQVTVLGSFVAVAVAGKLMLLLTPLSWFLVPVATGVLLAVLLVDRHAG